MADWDRNANSIKTHGFSCRESEDLYRLRWPDDKAARERYETGRGCLSCSFYAQFNQDYGLCCNPGSDHHLETMFEHTTCAAFKSRRFDTPGHVILPASDDLRSRKAGDTPPKPDKHNENSITTDGFSRRESEKRLRLRWPLDPIARENHDAGRVCSSCSSYAALNAEWGLCCNARAEARLETLSQHYSCSAYRWREDPVQPDEMILEVPRRRPGSPIGRR